MLIHLFTQSIVIFLVHLPVSLMSTLVTVITRSVVGTCGNRQKSEGDVVETSLCRGLR